MAPEVYVKIPCMLMDCFQSIPIYQLWLRDDTGLVTLSLKHNSHACMAHNKATNHSCLACTGNAAKASSPQVKGSAAMCSTDSVAAWWPSLCKAVVDKTSGCFQARAPPSPPHPPPLSSPSRIMLLVAHVYHALVTSNHTCGTEQACHMWLQQHDLFVS